MVTHPGQAASRRISLEFLPTPSEIKAGVRFQIRHRNRFGWCVGLGVVAVIVGAVTLGVSYRAAIVIVVIGAVDILLVTGLFEVATARQMKRMGNSLIFNLKEPARYQLHTCELWVVEPVHQPISWYVYVVERHSHLILSDMRFARVMVIPKRAFKSVPDARYFTHSIKNNALNQGPWLWRRLRGL